MHNQIFNELLKLAAESGASDIVVKSGKPGFFRLNGRLRAVDMDAIEASHVEAFVSEHVPEVFKDQWADEGQIDFAYVGSGVGRFRVNAFQQRGTISVVFRHIKNHVPSFAELNIEADPLIKLASGKDGILLVCGATGSGKSSTMAAMLNWINQNQDKHIITLEDPIEFTFEDEKSIFNQREIGLDVPSFPLAIKSVLRQNPDIIFIGEMRDRETFETAISAAETGHLVMSTMHAATVMQSLTRLFEFFPPEQLLQARRQIAGTLRGIVCQKLIPSIDGDGRFASHEILTVDGVVRNLILDAQNEKIQSILEGTVDTNSFAFNKDLYRLIKTGKISRTDGLRFSPNPQALEMNLKGIFIKN